MKKTIIVGIIILSLFAVSCTVPAVFVLDHTLTFGGYADITGASSPSVFVLDHTLTFGGYADITSSGGGDTPPVIDNNNPANQSYGQNIAFTYTVDFSDAQGNFNWWMNCSNSQSDSGSINDTGSIALTGLSHSTKYWVNCTAKDVNNITYKSFWFVTKAAGVFVLDHTLTFGGYANVVGPNPVISNIYPSNSSVDISGYPHLRITVTDPNSLNMDVAWSTNATGTWTHSNTTIASGSTIYQRATFANTSETKYWWTVKVNNSDGDWTNETYHFTLDNYTWSSWSDWWGMPFNGATPTISDVVPFDGNSSVQPGSVTLSALFNDTDGDNMNVTWYWANNWTSIGSNTTITNGTYSQDITVGYGDVVSWGINLTDNVTWINSTYSFTVIDLNPVSSFAASNYDSQSINITWSKNSNVSHTYIRYKKDSVPTGITDGVFLVNTTAILYDHSGLSYGTHYYYMAWGYNATDVVFSSSVSSDAYTNPGCPTSLQDTDSGMEQISFSWTKGTNATRSVVFMNNTGIGIYPNITNGIEKINNTGSIGTATDLVANTTYYFSVYSFNPVSGLWSECNSTDTGTTEVGAGNLTGFTATRFNDVQLNLSWTKGVVDDDTVVVRKLGNYPATVSDGTEVYNGSFSNYKDTGLTPATHYYYRAWSWNGEEFGAVYSSDSEKTRPSPPTDFTGDISGAELVMNWVKGTGATRTVIRNETGSYPSTPTSGDAVYNNTGTTTTVSGISSIDFYRGWSFTVVDGEGIFSLHTDLIWGGIEINVYKENNPSIEIGNYTVFLSKPGGETYYNTSQNNPFRIDVSDVPNGVDITVKISKDGYKSRTQVMDMFENTYYTVNFYLPPDSSGSPPGESEEPWYVPPIEEDTTIQTVTESVTDHTTDETLTAECNIKSIVAVYVYNDSIYGGWIEIGSDKYSYSGDVITVDSSVLDANSSTIKVEYYCDYDESYTHQYIIVVRDEIGNGIGNAYIVIKRYINTTDSYDTILSGYTDTAGQISCELMPDVDYYLEITHDSGDYVNTTATWSPPGYDATKTYILKFTEVTPDYPDSPAECISATAEITGTVLFVTIANSCDGDLYNVQMFVYENNLSNNITSLFGTRSHTGTFDSYIANFTGIDNNNTFTIIIHYNHTYWEYQTITIIIDGTNVTIDDSTGEYVDSLFERLYGNNPFGWHNIIMWIVLVVGMYYADQKDAGKILVLLGGVFLFLNIIVGFNSLLATVAGGALPALFIIVGILVMWRDSNKKGG